MAKINIVVWMGVVPFLKFPKYGVCWWRRGTMHRVEVVKCVLMCYEGGEVVRVIDLKDSQGVV